MVVLPPCIQAPVSPQRLEASEPDEESGLLPGFVGAPLGCTDECSKPMHLHKLLSPQENSPALMICLDFSG